MCSAYVLDLGMRHCKISFFVLLMCSHSVPFPLQFSLHTLEKSGISQAVKKLQPQAKCKTRSGRHHSTPPCRHWSWSCWHDLEASRAGRDLRAPRLGAGTLLREQWDSRRAIWGQPAPIRDIWLPPCAHHGSRRGTWPRLLEKLWWNSSH